MRFFRRSQSRRRLKLSAAKMAVTSSKTVSVTPPVLTFSKTWQTASLGRVPEQLDRGNPIALKALEDLELEPSEKIHSDLVALESRFVAVPPAEVTRCGQRSLPGGSSPARIPSRRCSRSSSILRPKSDVTLRSEGKDRTASMRSSVGLRHLAISR